MASGNARHSLLHHFRSPFPPLAMPVLDHVSGRLISGLRVGRYFQGRPNSTVWLWRVEEDAHGGAALIDTGPSNQEKEVARFAQVQHHPHPLPPSLPLLTL